MHRANEYGVYGWQGGIFLRMWNENFKERADKLDVLDTFKLYQDNDFKRKYKNGPKVLHPLLQITRREPHQKYEG